MDRAVAGPGAVGILHAPMPRLRRNTAATVQEFPVHPTDRRLRAPSRLLDEPLPSRCRSSDISAAPGGLSGAPASPSRTRCAAAEPLFWNQKMHDIALRSPPPVHYHLILGRSPERCTGESRWYSDPECSGVSDSAKTRARVRVASVHTQKRGVIVGFTAGKHVRQKCKK